jgi:hypothetical protein
MGRGYADRRKHEAHRKLIVRLPELASDAARLTEGLQQLDPADWRRSGRHPDFPRYDVHFQVEYMAHHEAHQIPQKYVHMIC